MSTVKFCEKCNNILHPKDQGKDKKILLYVCRSCNHQEVGDNKCVYRDEIHDGVGRERSTDQFVKDVAAHPTLPRTNAVPCANCNHQDAVFFKAAAGEEESMALIFVCRGCGYSW